MSSERISYRPKNKKKIGSAKKKSLLNSFAEIRNKLIIHVKNIITFCFAESICVCDQYGKTYKPHCDVRKHMAGHLGTA
jgi:hypothetical protein